MKLMSKIALLVAVMGIAVNVSAITEAELSAVQTTVTSVPAPEMPAKAAEVVKQANKKDRSAVARTAIKSIAAKNRTSVLVAVSAIIKVAPETAAVVAAAATQEVPDQAVEIARVAATAAPQHTVAIKSSVAAVTSVSPQQSAQLLGSVRSSAHANPIIFIPIIRNDPINTSNRVRMNDQGQIELANEFTEEDVPNETYTTTNVSIEYGARD